VSDAATERWVEDTAQQMLAWLHPGHLADEEQARILAGFFRACAKTVIPVYNRILGLRDMLDPNRIPGRMLPLLGHLVGLDGSAGFPTYLTEAHWRRFIAQAMEIWGDVGFDYRGMLVALVSRPVLVSEWHVRKDIVYASLLPWFGLTFPGATPWPEYTVDIHVPDPYGVAEDLGLTLTSGEKRANRELVHGVLNALRPWNQRLDVYWYAFVEDWTQGAFQWTRVSGSAASLDASARTLTVGASTNVKMDVGNATSVWRLFTWDSMVTFNAGGVYDFRARYDSVARDSALVRVTVDAANPPASTVAIYREDAAVLTLLASRTFKLSTEVMYHIQIDLQDGTTATFDDDAVYIDGNSAVSASGGIPEAFLGPCGFNPGAGAELVIQYTEVAVHPVDKKRVGPDP